MLHKILCSPPLLLLIVAVVATLVQRLTARLAGGAPSSLHESICVVMVCPPGVTADRGFDLMRRARHPHRVRLNVVKVVRGTEVATPVPDEHRHSIRLRVISSARFQDTARARLLTLLKSYQGEKYVCMVSHRVRVEEAWDEQAIGALAQCPDRSVLIAPPAPPSLDGRGVFARPTTTDLTHAHLEAVRFSCISDSPCPSLFWSAHFSFSGGSIVTELPPAEAVSDAVEEAKIGQFLFQRGYGFYTAATSFVSARGESLLNETAPVKVTDAAPHGAERTLDEYYAWVGARGKKAGRRTRLGLLPRASQFECDLKYGSRERVQELLLES